MRAIDSALTLCRRYEKELTVLWKKDRTLNCSFEELFLTPGSEGFELIEYINDLPMPFLNLINEVATQNSEGNRVVENGQLYKIYNSSKYIDSLNITEIDSIFYTKANKLITPLFEGVKAPCLITSCYRLCEIENNYSSFAPALDLRGKIEKTTNKYKNTIGIHIRRSDHKTSLRYSPTSKFVIAMEEALNARPTTTFFLSTDDKETKDKILKRFGNKIIVNDIDSYDRDDRVAIKNAVIDLFCLSETTVIYGSHHSTFSQVASDIGGIEEITIK